MIAASQLYDYVQCPHRVYLDAFGDPLRRDEPNAFVQLLWDQGVDHEAQIVATLGVTADMSAVSFADRERETRLAMQRGEPLIYQGRLTSGDRLGAPDLLERRGTRYIAGDIKSGSGFDGDEGDGKLKKHYAVQVGHYAHILDLEGFGVGHEAFVIDRVGDRVPYVLDEPQGVRNKTTWWEAYLEADGAVRSLLGQTSITLPALGATCKLCQWYSACKSDIIASDDLTMVAELGRSKRDAMIGTIPTVHALASCDPQGFVVGKKTTFPGIGPDSLVKFHERAKLLATPGAKPYLKAPVTLLVAQNEV